MTWKSWDYSQNVTKAKLPWSKRPRIGQNVPKNWSIRPHGSKSWSKRPRGPKIGQNVLINCSKWYYIERLVFYFISQWFNVYKL